MNQHLLLASERVVERHGAGLQLRAHHPLRFYRSAEEGYREPERLVALCPDTSIDRGKTSKNSVVGTFIVEY